MGFAKNDQRGAARVAGHLQCEGGVSAGVYVRMRVLECVSVHECFCVCVFVCVCV